MSSFAAQIRALRHARQLSQSDLADQAGVGRTMVSRVERGLQPPMHVVVKLAQALDTDHRELLALAAEPLMEPAHERG